MREGAQRAIWAEKALKAREKVAKIGPDEPDQVRLAYMLADLMHWAESQRVPFDEALGMAGTLYEEER